MTGSPELAAGGDLVTDWWIRSLTVTRSSARSAPGARMEFVVITTDGRLLPRTVEDWVVVDEWGEVYQQALWDAVRAEVDPGRGQVGGLGLNGGMRAKLVEDADRFPLLYPVNPVASAMLAVLGLPRRVQRGAVVVVGTEDAETGITASLTGEQHALLDRAYRLAVGVPDPR